jgi:hypothetical protein
MLTQAQIDKQNKMLRKLRIAEFINCPDCNGQGFEITYDEYPQGFEKICQLCDGVGRIYFNKKKTLLDRWYTLPSWKRANIAAMFMFSGMLFIILGIMKACGL